MQIKTTALPGVLLIEPDVFKDARGGFYEAFSTRRYAEEAGIEMPFVQDNVSCSNYGVLRGLHYQRQHPQGKLVQVLQGSIFDVVVDVDPHSSHYRRHVATTLSADDHRQLWVPPGYAHGFCVTSLAAVVHYKCTAYYDPEDEAGVMWNCPSLAIPWPLHDPVLSQRDRSFPLMR